MRIAIDDFGTGYATLDYLRHFSMADYLKIDRAFVEGVDRPGSQEAAIVSAAIALAKSLGFTVVAEGVETLFQMEALRALDCELAQGYLFSRPLPASRRGGPARLPRGLSAAALPFLPCSGPARAVRGRCWGPGWSSWSGWPPRVVGSAAGPVPTRRWRRGRAGPWPTGFGSCSSLLFVVGPVCLVMGLTSGGLFGPDRHRGRRRRLGVAVGGVAAGGAGVGAAGDLRWPLPDPPTSGRGTPGLPVSSPVVARAPVPTADWYRDDWPVIAGGVGGGARWWPRCVANARRRRGPDGAAGLDWWPRWTRPTPRSSRSPTAISIPRPSPIRGGRW